MLETGNVCIFTIIIEYVSCITNIAKQREHTHTNIDDKCVAHNKIVMEVVKYSLIE